MTTTVIGVFDDPTTVRKVMDELVEAGCQGSDIEILEGDEDEIVAEVTAQGFDEDDAREFAEAAASGKALLLARAPAGKADQATAIMERYEAPATNGEDEEKESEETVPEVEEEVSVEKRETARGGVRVTSRVRERPVAEKVRLREEEVSVERRPADRRLSPEEAEAAFQEKTVEMTETAEEVEVHKEARVVEEIALSKEAEEHEETVRDKARRTEVEVEEIDASKARKSR